MSKWKRQEIGDIVKSKEAGKPDYIKIKTDVVFKKGDTLNLESKASKLEGITKALESGKLTEEQHDQIKEKIDNTPDWVRFNIVKVSKVD